MDGEAIDIRSIFGLVRRRAGLIIAVTCLALSAAAVTLAAVKPVFTSTALVLVDPSKKNLLDPDTQASVSGADSARVDSEVELVKSDTTLLAVARELDLVKDSEFGLKLGMREMLLAFLRIEEPVLPTGNEALAAILDKLSDAITVQRKGLTYLIAVSARTGRPEFSAKLANSVARNYIQQQLDAKVSSTLASRDIIRARIADAAAAVAQSENAFDSFIDKNLARIGEATGRTDFGELRDQIEQIAAARSETTSIVGNVEQSLARRDWAAIASSLKNEAILNLDRQRVALTERLAGAVKGGHSATDLRSSLEQVEKQLDDMAAKAITGLKQDLTASQAKVTELRGQLRTSILDSQLPSDILTSIYEAQQSAEIARSQYQTLLIRQKDLDTQAFLQVADSRVVSEAIPPSTPSFPNPRLILALAGIVGVGLGLGLAFLLENYLGGITTEAQAQSILGMPVVSIVPRQRGGRKEGTDGLTVADLLLAAPLSAYSEAIRRTRIGIDQAVSKRCSRDHAAGAQHKGLVVAVSSAAPNEGKSTVALSLARAYALSGMATLLVDCDLRKPSLHRQLGKEPSEGLLEYLSAPTDPGDLTSLVTSDKGSGLRILLGSRRSDVATDQLVAGKTFRRLIEAAKRNFDVVVLDTPPLGPIVDGLYLAAVADAVVFVVKWASTPQREVKAAVEMLVGATAQNTPVLAVLNQQNASPSRLRGAYGSYYAET